MSKLFIPIAWIMGVEWAECDLVANLVALKCIVNEFAAYSKLSEYINQGIISVSLSFEVELIEKNSISDVCFDRNARKQ